MRHRELQRKEDGELGQLSRYLYLASVALCGIWVAVSDVSRAGCSSSPPERATTANSSPGTQ